MRKGFNFGITKDSISDIAKKIAYGFCGIAMAAALSLTPSFTVKADVTAGQAIAKGIDVSSYQGIINWAAVKSSGISFAFIRIGTSKGWDTAFDYNIRNAQANGIKTGVYFYSYAVTPEQVTAEATNVCNILDNYTLQMPVVFDIESSYQKALGAPRNQALCTAWYLTVDSRGYYPMIYSGRNFFVNSIGDVPMDKWVAQYYERCNYPGALAFWQATDKGRIPGIGGNVDLDYQYKDYSNLIINTGFAPRMSGMRYYSNYKMVKGWFLHEGKKYFTDEAGNLVTGTFLSDGVGTCYLDPTDGHALVGPTQIGEFSFLFDAEGRMQYGLQTVGTDAYYYAPDTGAMVKSSLFALPDGGVCFAGADGKLAAGLVDVGGRLCLFDAATRRMVVNTTMIMGEDCLIIDGEGTVHAVPLSGLTALGLSPETITPEIMANLLTMF